MAEDYPDRISEMFVGKNIFITGGTGFMGKVLIEKILRQCPEVGDIYLLIRPKKGKNPQVRIKELLAGPLFEKLRSIRNVDLLAEKCKVIEGDVAEKNLGIKEEDWKLLIRKIHYIYHIAATVRFDEPLKKALLMNTRGTKYMLALAKECLQLELFGYVSTAYVHPHEKFLEEKAYPPAADPHSVIATVENLSAEIVDVMTPKLLGTIPNTYTYTKSLSEGLVVEQMDHLPIIILRPSVVVPVWREPLPGWGENINGPMGLFIGGGKGVVRSMYGNGDCYADFIPVDVAANAICICSYDYITYKKRRIFNLTSSDEVKYTWNELLDTGRKIVTTTTPFNWILWFPRGGLTQYKFYHYIRVLLCQIIPAIFIDAILLCVGQKPVLLKIQKKILKGYELLQFYATAQWDFDKSNGVIIKNYLNPRETKMYYVGKENLNFEEYVTNVILGARRFILKEPDSTLPTARRHLKIMWSVDLFFKALMVFSVFYFLYNKIVLSFI